VDAASAAATCRHAGESALCRTEFRHISRGARKQTSYYGSGSLTAGGNKGNGSAKRPVQHFYRTAIAGNAMLSVMSVRLFPLYLLNQLTSDLDFSAC